GPETGRTPRVRRWRCRNPRPGRTGRHGCRNRPGQDRRGTSPCSGRTEWGHAVRFRPRSCDAGSPLVPLSLSTVLGRSCEHLDDVVVQTRVELLLEAPFDLRVITIAVME